MSISVFTQCVGDDGDLMDYEPAVAPVCFGATRRVPQTQPKFQVIHDVARPATRFTITRAGTSSLAEPVQTTPLQLDYNTCFFHRKVFMRGSTYIYPYLFL